MVGIDPKTLRKHYRDELDFGETKANAQVAGFLFKAASNGNVTAQIYLATWPARTGARQQDQNSIRNVRFAPIATKFGGSAIVAMCQ